jgi:hypothetical protein
MPIALFVEKFCIVVVVVVVVATIYSALLV